MPSRYETLSLRLDARGVAYVELDRPDKRNALSAQCIHELTDVALGCGASADTRAMVLSGAGKLFCAGADLNWMMDQIQGDRASRMAEARKIADMLHALNTMPTPLIVRVHGAALAGGFGLTCVADVAVAEEDAVFALTETRLGLIPATISPYVLARLGEGNARRVFMSARRFGAEEAMHLGAIAKVVSVADLDDAIEAEVSPYLSVAPGAVGLAKALARRLGPRIDDDVIDMSIEHLADCWESEEAAEGVASFLEKRPARWVAG